MATILESSLMTNFLYPLVLMFVLTFAILEKIQIFKGSDGGDKKQLHAVISLVIALIFVSAVFPKLIVANLVQFMTVGLVVIFVALMLWGFVSGQSSFPKKMTTVLGGIIGVAVLFAVLWATGLGSPIVVGFQKFFTFLFGSGWSGAFWTNAILIGLIGIVIALVLKSGAGTGTSTSKPAAGK
jgi:hypothetical protein